MLWVAKRFEPLIVLFLGLSIATMVAVNVIDYREEDTSVKILPIKLANIPDPAKKMDDEWRAKVAAHKKWLDEAHEEHLWREDIKRELHSMRAQYNVFLKDNNKIRAERREQARQEMIRIQKEKLAKRKRIRQENLENLHALKQQRSEKW